MANPAITYTFTNGTAADATEVNTNFQDIIDSLTDGTKSLTMDAATFSGTVTCNGNVTLGNGTGDDITVTGSLAATLNIKTDGSFDLGSTTKGLQVAYFGDGGGNTVGIQAPAIASNFTLTLPGYTSVMPAADGAANDFLKTDGSGTMAWVGGHAITSLDNTATATTAYKFISADTNANGAWTLTLYAASGNSGREITIMKTTSDTNALTIDGNGAETINGATTFLLYQQYESVTIKCDGSNWLVIDHKVKNLYEEKTLGSNVTSTGDISDLTFNNLIVGKHYRATLIADLFVNNAGPNEVAVFIKHNGVSGPGARWNPAGATSNSRTEYATEYVFEAAATSVVATASTVDSNNYLVAGSTMLVEELNNYAVTTVF